MNIYEILAVYTAVWITFEGSSITYWIFESTIKKFLKKYLR